MMYTTVAKKGKGYKKLLPPSVRTQPINKMTKGHRGFNYVHLGPGKQVTKEKVFQSSITLSQHLIPFKKGKL